MKTSRALCLLEVLFQVLHVPRPLHLSSVWIRQLVGSWSSCSYHPVRAFPFRTKSSMVGIPGVLAHLPEHPIFCSELPHAYVLVVITRDPLLTLGHFLRSPFPFLLQQVQAQADLLAILLLIEVFRPMCSYSNFCWDYRLMTKS